MSSLRGVIPDRTTCDDCGAALTIPQIRQRAVRCKACKAVFAKSKRRARYDSVKGDPERYAVLREAAKVSDRQRRQSAERRSNQRDYDTAWRRRNGIGVSTPADRADRRIEAMEETACAIPWRECKWCGKKFIARGPRTTYCSPEHTNQAKRARPENVTLCACGYVVQILHAGKCSECLREAKRNRRRRERSARKARILHIVREPYTLDEIADRDRHRCQIPDCLHPRTRVIDMTLRVPHEWAPTIDHIVPTTPRVGGDDTRANVQLAHFKCNYVKRDGGWQQLRLVG